MLREPPRLYLLVGEGQRVFLESEFLRETEASVVLSQANHGPGHTAVTEVRVRPMVEGPGGRGRTETVPVAKVCGHELRWRLSVELLGVWVCRALQRPTLSLLTFWFLLLTGAGNG